jgi:hypothetical protein
MYVAIVIAAISMFFLFGPFRRMIVRRKPVIEEDTRAQNSGHVKILLIHGTFSRGAPWTKPGSNFYSFLHSAFGTNISVDALLWSGDNSQSCRMEAVELCQDWLADCNAEYIYLIGHSHGGAVATLAASKLSRENVKVITMSTPFINISPKYAGIVQPDANEQGMSDEIRLFYAVKLVTVLICGNLALELFNQYARFYQLCFSGMVLAAFSLRIAYRKASARKKIVEKIRGIRESISIVVSKNKITLPTHALLILRTTGDEATGLLAASHFCCWLITIIFSAVGYLLGGIRVLEKKIAKYVSIDFLRTFSAVYAVVCGIYVQACVMSSITIPASVFQTMLWAYLIFATTVVCANLRLLTVITEALCVALTTPVVVILALPFGSELAFKSTFVRISVESAPIGRWVTMTIASGSLLSHSEIYSRTEIAELLRDFHIANSKTSRG